MVLLLSCPPLWGNDPESTTPRDCAEAFNSTCLPHWGRGPEITVDEARSTFRVAGAAPDEMMAGSWRKPLVLPGHEGRVSRDGVSLSADGRFVVTGGVDGAVRAWDAATGELLHTMEGHEGSVWDVAISANGRTAVSTGGDGTVRVWDVRDAKLLHTMQDQGNSIRAMSLSADGRIMLSRDDHGTVRVWDTRDGKLLHTMHDYLSRDGDVAISADGRIALSGSEHWQDYGIDINVWDVAAAKHLHAMGGHTSSVNVVALSADGRIALSGDNRGTVRVWNAWSGNSLYTMESHGGSIWEVSLSTDGRVGMSQSDDTVRMWDITTAKFLHVIKGSKGELLSADGRVALSRGEDGTVRLWRFPLSNPQSMLRQAAEYYTGQVTATHVGPAIPEPEMPPPVDGKDPFESMAMYQQRVAAARAKRERQVRDIEARHRAAVEQRKARIRGLDETQRRDIRLTAHARAFAEVFGHPMLAAVREASDEPGPESPTTPPGMRLTLQFQHAKDSQDWYFAVPPGEPTKNLRAALAAGEVSATTEYQLEDDVPALAAVYARHGDLQYKGTAAE